ncbi:MAG TPA: hypothetical protein VEB68_06770 [Croceibacterium sp.]|nr:hypothetical protein [Croceibacterium sp.]
MNKAKLTGIALAASAAVLAAAPAISQGGAAPVARYTIDAGTMSGMAAMSAGGGVGGVLGALGGGGSQVAHELVLRLGSSRAATGEPQADHFMPAGARLGASVPLVTPRAAPTGPSGSQPSFPQGQLPQGRLLIFWGCGEHAPAGQPVVVDFSRLARGEMPAGLMAQSLNLPDEWQIDAGNSRTYGEWPNQRDSQRVPANASLLGAHRIVGNYAPEIAFDLADDFMPALRPATSDLASGGIGLGWNGIAQATGYYAWAMGAGAGNDSRDMVMWSSSSSQQTGGFMGGSLSGWLSPAAVGRLVDAGTVMPPSQTTCAIPAEVKAAAGPGMMINLNAYGPEADFAYPPRPAAARAAWKPEWTARVRFRSNVMLIPGMPGFGDDGDGGQANAGQADAPKKPRCRGLRGIAERAAGLCE